MLNSIIPTFNGRHFDYSNPTVQMIDIHDIARALSHECRFAGHVRDFYSVAQHSFECSMMVKREFALEALLHDAAEAYCKDIPTPFKALLPDYQQIEQKIDAVIRQKFKLPETLSAEVKQADLIMLATEKQAFNIDANRDWQALNGIAPRRNALTPLAPNVAYRLFLTRFNSIIRAR